jgi:hypothetical protein
MLKKHYLFSDLLVINELASGNPIVSQQLPAPSDSVVDPQLAGPVGGGRR